VAVGRKDGLPGKKFSLQYNQMLGSGVEEVYVYVLYIRAGVNVNQVLLQVLVQL
jgi:hypothetical protein